MKIVCILYYLTREAFIISKTWTKKNYGDEEKPDIAIKHFLFSCPGDDVLIHIQ